QRAFMVDVAAVRVRTALAGGAWRQTRINRSYNDDGLVTQVEDLGDVADAADDQCTRTWYARSDPTWLIALASRAESVATSCGATPSYPAQAISDVRTYYDGGALGAPPPAGNPTTIERLDSYSGGQPVYVTAARTTYDAYGRPLDTFDAL